MAEILFGVLKADFDTVRVLTVFSFSLVILVTKLVD